MSETPETTTAETPEGCLNRVKLVCETTRVQPRQLAAYHGETLELEIYYQTYGEPVNLTGAELHFWFRTAADAENHWHEGAVEQFGPSSVLARFRPRDDAGQALVEWFVQVSLSVADDAVASYRACGTIRLVPSPGFVPAVLPPAAIVLDFDEITVLHAPYWTKAEADARFAPAGDYATRADATLNAVEWEYSEWAVTSAQPDIVIRAADNGQWVPCEWDGLDERWINVGMPKGTADSTHLVWDASDAQFDIDATRTATPTAYRLGPEDGLNPSSTIPAPAAIPAPSSATPAMDGTASAGSSAAFARGDHVHPHDTSKLDTGGGTMTGNLDMGSAPVTFGTVDITSGANSGELLFVDENGNTVILSVKDGLTIAYTSDTNLLPVASPTVSGGAFDLNPETAVYRVSASLSGTAATIPTPDATAIPIQSAYYAFELEVTVDSTATTLSGPSGWTWLPDGELPTDPADFAGKILHIAARLDCAQGARGIVANCWRVEDAP